LEDLDIVAIQETIKHDFSDQELKDMVGNKDFSWIWALARGHSGGLITGIKVDDFELEQSVVATFLLAVLIMNRKNNHRFWVLSNYGPMQHNLSGDFLQEVKDFCVGVSLPILMGGF
jgi:hypothetical protein